jgi:hypothetical protein
MEEGLEPQSEKGVMDCAGGSDNQQFCGAKWHGKVGRYGEITSWENWKAM